MSNKNSTLSNYRLTVSYDGRAYLGWQRHGDKPTIQYALERAIENSFGIHTIIKGSGRTDRGAHANGQVASVELPAALQPGEIEKQLNSVLDQDIRVTDVSTVADDFHARDSAIGKRYRFIIWSDTNLPQNHDGRVWHVKKSLDVQAMIDACSVFEGMHDFASFATRPNFKQKTTCRTVSMVAIHHELPLITIDICADGFLYKMVRNIVRTIAKVGEGRYTRDDLYDILKAKDRKAAPGTAPASGLYLERVYYSENEMSEDIKRVLSNE